MSCDHCLRVREIQTFTFYRGAPTETWVGYQDIGYASEKIVRTKYSILPPIQYSLCGRCVKKKLRWSVTIPMLLWIVISLILIDFTSVIVKQYVVIEAIVPPLPARVIYVAVLILMCVYFYAVMRMHSWFELADSTVAGLFGILAETSIAPPLFWLLLYTDELPTHTMLMGLLLYYSIFLVHGLLSLFIVLTCGLWKVTKKLYLEDFCARLWRKKNKEVSRGIKTWNSAEYQQLEKWESA